MKKWGVVVLIVAVIVALYFIEYSKINTGTSDTVPTLDQLNFDHSAKNWDDFYRVRAKIIDGQSAEFSIPVNLKEKIGEKIELKGAAVFFSPGCSEKGDSIAVHSFFLLPTIGLANACEHLPEIAMRWTIRVNLDKDWLLTREDMIESMVNVEGKFRIDTQKPYEAAFFLDDSTVKIISNEEVEN